MAPTPAPTDIGTSRVCAEPRVQKKGRSLVRLGATTVRSSGAVALCTSYTVSGLPELCGPEFEPCSSVTLPALSPHLSKLHKYSWTSLCETHNAHAMGHGAAPDISWTIPTDQIDPGLGTLLPWANCPTCAVWRQLVLLPSPPSVGVPHWRPLNHGAGSNPKQTSLIHCETLAGGLVVVCGVGGVVLGFCVVGSVRFCGHQVRREVPCANVPDPEPYLNDLPTNAANTSDQSGWPPPTPLRL